jgi:2-hydroxychromene-2-carboxylate isomerase
MRASCSFVSLIFLIVVAACPNKSNTATPSGTPTPSPAPAAAVAPKAKPLAFTEFGSLKLDKLSAEQKATFAKFANEELCPCDCPKTFAGCVQTASKCKPAVILGQWIVDRLGEGIPLDMMAQPLAQEIGMGFRGHPQIIDLEGFHAKGAKNPTYTLVEFADFECAHCKPTALVIEELVKKYPKKLKVVYKHYPLPAHPMAKRAAIAAEAAGLQGKFWEMHKALFAFTQPLSEDAILKIADKIFTSPAKQAKFRKDLDDPKVLAKVELSAQEAGLLGLSGTPSIFFNGRQYHLSLDMLGLELRIAMEDARAAASCN